MGKSHFTWIVGYSTIQFILKDSDTLLHGVADLMITYWQPK